MLNLGAAGTLSGSAASASAVTYTISGLELTGSVEVYKILAQGQLAVIAATLYTAPGGAESFIKDILLCNVTALPVAIALYAGPSGAGVAAGNQICGLTIPANGMMTLDDTGIKVYDGNGAIGTQMALVLTGDVSGQGIGSIATTLATVNANVGAIGDASHVVTMTLDAKGRVLAAAAVAVAVTTSPAGQTPVGVTRLLNTTAPLAGGGDLTADRTLTIAAASDSLPGSMSAADKTKLDGIAGVTVPQTRLINTTAPITGGGDLSADRTLALTQSGLTAAAATIKPKDLFGTVYVDAANTAGWAGADVGAWINAAWAYLVATYGTNGGVIQIGPGAYNFTTPIIIGVQYSSVILRGSGNDAGLGVNFAGTTLNYTATTGVAITLGGGSNNTGGARIEMLALNGTAIGNSATGIQWGSNSGPAFSIAGGSMQDVSVQLFGNGVTWRGSGLAYAIQIINCKIQNCTTGLKPQGENNVMVGGLIGGCTTGVDGSLAGTELMCFGVAFDDTIVNISTALFRMSLMACRFENPSLTTTSNYIVISAGHFSMFGGGLQDDNLVGGTNTATGFVQGTGGTVNIQGTWIYSGGRVLPQAFNISGTCIAHIDPILGQSSAGITTLFPAGFGRQLDWARVNNQSTAVQTQTVVAGTTYYIAGSNLNMPVTLQGIRIGTVFRWNFTIAKSQLGTAAFNIVIFGGTLGTTGDTAIVTQSLGTGTAAADVAEVTITAVWTAVGASGTFVWNMGVSSKGGAAASGFGVPLGTAGYAGTSGAFNTTTAGLKFGIGFANVTGVPVVMVAGVQANALELY